jgi:antirestriction protein ArdC
MPNELHQRLTSLLASIGFNDGANKGFWRFQPREKFGKDAGQWIEMGAELRMFFKNKRGQTDSVTGRAVGSTGSPDGVRVLVQGQGGKGVPDGIYGADTANVRIAEGIIPEEVLEKQGIKNTPKISKEQEALLPTIDQLERADITDGDLRLINEGAKSKEAKQQAEYKKSVVAQESKGKKGDEDIFPKDPSEDLPIIPSSSDRKRPKGVSKDARYTPPRWPLGGSQEQGYWTEPDGSVVFDNGQKMGPDKLEDNKFDFEGQGKKDIPKSAKPAEADADPRDSDPDLKATVPFSTNIGDVIRGRDGKDRTIVDIKFDIDQGGVSKVKLQNEDGSIEDFNFDPKKPFYKVKNKKGKPAKPAKPAKPEAKPETPAATPKPEKPAAAPTPAKPEEKPEPTPETKGDKSALTKPENTIAPLPPANFPPTDRVDDGSDIEMGKLSAAQVAAARKKRATPLRDANGVPEAYVDEKGKLKTASDPFSLMNVLAEVFPNSKFTKDGLNLILTRMKDKDGRIFELRASNAGQKTVSYSMRWTDPNTGEVEELFHYDTRHSVQALFTKSNGPDGLMDKILGRNGFETLTNGGSTWGPDASFRERAQWFVQKQKMADAEKTALTIANGVSQILHQDKKNYGRVARSEIRSTWDAVAKLFDGNISETLTDEIYLRLEKIMGSVPSTDLAHKQVLTALRKEYKNRFGSRENGAVDAIVTALFTNASMRAKGKSFNKQKDAGFRANPYASANRHTPLEEGMVVEYENNVGKISIVKVLSKHTNFSVAAGKNNDVFDFGDYVTIIDSEGTTRTLSSLELRILKDQNTALTPYTPGLKNEELTNYRIKTGELRPRGSGNKRDVPGTRDVISKPQADPGFTGVVDDLIPGDDIYDQDGTRLGEIIAVQPTQDDDGNDGFAFLVSDPEGDEIAVFYPQGTEVSSSKAPEDPEETVFYRMMAEEAPLSSSINPVPDASSIDAPVGGPVDDTDGKQEVQETRTAVDKVLSVMLEAIKGGQVPWRKPFKDDPRLAGAALPRNPKTKHIYSGTNRLVLRFMADLKGYEDGRWMTYNQASDMGGQVRKGEKGTFILVPKIIPVKDKDGKPALDAKGNKKTFVKFDAIAVFNVSQIDGLDLPDDVKNTDLQAKTPLQAQEFVLARYLKSMEALGLEIPKIRYTYVGEYGSHSSSPNWSPNSDVITLPTLEQFNSPDEIFDTLMHELAHSTGHPSRLDRSALTKDYGNSDGVSRAKEELIAEISSALFQQMFGITSNLDNSAAYVQSWLKRLQNNPEEVINATKEAQKVVDYMLGIHLGDWSPVDGYTLKGA